MPSEKSGFASSDGSVDLRKSWNQIVHALSGLKGVEIKEISVEDGLSADESVLHSAYCNIDDFDASMKNIKPDDVGQVLVYFEYAGNASHLGLFLDNGNYYFSVQGMDKVSQDKLMNAILAKSKTSK